MTIFGQSESPSPVLHSMAIVISGGARTVAAVVWNAPALRALLRERPLRSLILQCRRRLQTGASIDMAQRKKEHSDDKHGCISKPKPLDVPEAPACVPRLHDAPEEPFLLLRSEKNTKRSSPPR